MTSAISIDSQNTTFLWVVGILFSLGTVFRETLPFGVAEACLALASVSLIFFFADRAHLWKMAALFSMLPAAAAISWVLNGAWSDAARYVGLVVVGVGTAFSLAVCSERVVRPVLTIVAISAGIVALLTGLSMVLNSHGVTFLPSAVYGSSGYARGAGLLGGPNEYGFAMFVALLFVIELNRPLKNSWMTLLGAIILAGLILSLSRTAMLAVFFFALISIAVDHGRWREYFLIVIGATVLVFLVWIGLAAEQIATTFALRTEQTLDASRTRLDLTIEAFEVFTRGNWLWGAGLADYSKMGQFPHNTYASILADYGLLGVASLMTFMLVTLLAACRHIPVSIAPMAIVVALCVSGFTNDFQFIREWWMAWGFAWALVLQPSPKSQDMLAG